MQAMEERSIDINAGLATLPKTEMNYALLWTHQVSASGLNSVCIATMLLANK